MSPVASAISAKTGGAMKSASHHHQSGLAGSSGVAISWSSRAFMGSIIFASLWMKYCSMYIWPTAWSSACSTRGPGCQLSLFAEIQHGLLVFVAGHRVGDAHEAGVERGPGPVGLRLGGHAAELPVGNELHGLGKIGLLEFRREILCERAGGGQRISGRRDAVLVCAWAL